MGVEVKAMKILQVLNLVVFMAAGGMVLAAMLALIPVLVRLAA